MYLRERLRESKWEIVSCILTVTLTLWLYFNHKEPQPPLPSRTWPPGSTAQYIHTAKPPLGKHTCRTDGAPGPVEIRFCYAGPETGLKICDSRLVYVDGKPSSCEVLSCPPLPGKSRHYEVMLGCFLKHTKASKIQR